MGTGLMRLSLTTQWMSIQSSSDCILDVPAFLFRDLCMSISLLHCALRWIGRALLIVGLVSAIDPLLGAGPPNIIYVLADDLGYGDLGCMGQKHILTPSLDRMAAEGLLFTRHYAGGPVCGPSRATLMTGMSQAIGFIKGNPGGDWRKENLRAQDVTVAEKLKEAGYETACFGKWGLGPRGRSGYPTSQGFDRFVGYDTHAAAHNYYPRRLCQDDGYVELPNGQYSHDVFARLILEYLRAEHGRPFFLYVPFTIPHIPLNPPDLGSYADRNWPDSHKKYAAMITRMDRDIGRMLDLLKEQGIAKNTLVVFSSDNGPQSSYGKGVSKMTKFFKSGGPLRGIKRDVLEGGVRVPMIAWWPGSIEPGSTDHVSGFQDIMPTFCELAGVDPPADIDGVSFVPTLRDEPEKQERHKFLYWEFIRMVGDDMRGSRQAVLHVSENVKAIRYGINGSIKLFDLDESPDEKVEIRSPSPGLALEMKRLLDESRSPSKLWPRSALQEGWQPK